MLRVRARSGPVALAKPEEAVLADIAAKRHQTDAAQQKIKQPAMRPPDIRLTALGTRNRHGQQSPKNLRLVEAGISSSALRRPDQQVVALSLGRRADQGDTSMMLPSLGIRNRGAIISHSAL
jgi:hypothetical protein